MNGRNGFGEMRIRITKYHSQLGKQIFLLSDGINVQWIKEETIAYGGKERGGKKEKEVEYPLPYASLHICQL